MRGSFCTFQYTYRTPLTQRPSLQELYQGPHRAWSHTGLDWGEAEGKQAGLTPRLLIRAAKQLAVTSRGKARQWG